MDEKTGKPGADEQAMLDYIDNPDPALRLSCQIKLTDDHDGLIVRVSEKQY